MSNWYPIDSATEPAWWTRCVRADHDTSILSLAHRGKRYRDAVEFFCSTCGRGQTTPLPAAPLAGSPKEHT